MEANAGLNDGLEAGMSSFILFPEKIDLILVKNEVSVLLPAFTLKYRALWMYFLFPKFERAHKYYSSSGNIYAINEESICKCAE